MKVESVPWRIVRAVGFSSENIGAGLNGGGEEPAEFVSVNPATGASLKAYRAATSREVAEVCAASAEAFDHNAGLEDLPLRTEAMLTRTADAILAMGDSLLAMASSETGLPMTPRLSAERDRTLYTLRLFARLAQEDNWRREVVDEGGVPGATGAIIPHLRRRLVPIGPVAVFGASNFPLAYSTAGQDTASALGCGCPVIVKAHPLHPGTSRMVAEALHQAVAHAGLHPATFQHLLSGGMRDVEVGRELVMHPGLRGVGFTGSLAGGMALTRLAASRTVPIPVFAEMGSINPVFVLPRALETDAEAIAQRIFQSVFASTGQQCTCPGLVFAVAGPALERFKAALAGHVRTSIAQPMLSSRMRGSFLSRVHEVAAPPGVETLARGLSTGLPGTNGGELQPMVVLACDAATFRRYPTLGEECFGPSTIIVACSDETQMLASARAITGSLAASIFAKDGVAAASPDGPLRDALRAILIQRVGRLILNNVTTGVEVSPAMVQGGPFPATNRPESTAVGPYALERWCRPVCFQNWG